MLLPTVVITLFASLVCVKSTTLAPPQINAGCTFSLIAASGHNGSVGQLADGQIRVGSDLTPSLFTWFGDAFVDLRGRGCWWTPPTLVLQCDSNQQPNHGFVIGCYGGVSYQHQSVFYQCQTGEGDQVNLYLEPNGAECSTITLRAGSCRPPCAGENTLSRQSIGMISRATTRTKPLASTSAPHQPSASLTKQLPSRSISTTASSSISKSAPTQAPGNCKKPIFDRPDEIILIDKSKPDTSNGSNPNMLVQLTPNVSAIFVFDFSASDSNKQCVLTFDLPSTLEDEEFSLYMLNGTGLVNFALLEEPPANPENTTYNNAPHVVMPLEAVNLEPGMSAQPLEFPCPGEDGHIVVLMRDRKDSGVYLQYRQYKSDVPIGLYLLKC
ncbi:ubiquitin 3 binding protein But2 C-terminal domain-containing protein [Daldinia sp. FL1419]|nr:ubiquitin 3 binding protein But2 C-terminal domain-containing protein [Daldinia sp. FL1419]